MAKRKITETSGRDGTLVVKKMAKKRARVAAGSRPSNKAARTTGRYEVAAVTRDGVRILRGKVRPKHFTSKQIRKAIESSLSAKA
jgi:hypothetical protein